MILKPNLAYGKSSVTALLQPTPPSLVDIVVVVQCPTLCYPMDGSKATSLMVDMEH